MESGCKVIIMKNKVRNLFINFGNIEVIYECRMGCKESLLMTTHLSCMDDKSKVKI